MADLDYDFDIRRILPREGGAEPARGGVLSATWRAGDARAGYRALFRAPATRDALRRAPGAVRETLEAAGFGYGTCDSGAPAGFYPAGDEAAQVDVLLRLSANMPPARAVEARVAEGAFDFEAFIFHAACREPLCRPGPRGTIRARPGGCGKAIARAGEALAGLAEALRGGRRAWS